MRPDELLTEISSIRGQAPGFIASDSRETLGSYRDCPRKMTDSRSNFSGQFRLGRLK